MSNETPQAPAADEPSVIPLPTRSGLGPYSLRRDGDGWALYWGGDVLRALSKYEAQFVDAAIRATRGMGQAAEPVAWRPKLRLIGDAMEAGRTWNNGKPTTEDIAYWGRFDGIEYAYAAPRAEAAAPAEPPLNTDQDGAA